MERAPEPELMEDEQQSLAYAQADFSASNQFFVDRLVRDFPGHLGAVVDIGCGPADVVIRLARAVPSARITAIDGSAPMLALARNAVAAAGLDHHITLHCGRIPGPLRDHAFDAVISKDLLHHLPDPSVLWKEAVLLGRPGAAIVVMDLVRPSSTEEARRIVEEVSGNEAAILKEDFYNSLCAAYTVDEVRAQLASAGLQLGVEQVSERHLMVAGRIE
jgi:ubiquinone/menaquinone biosynthesis C-methylase UbiE